MTKYIGIWIDHKEAHVVIYNRIKESIKHITSGIEKWATSGGGSRGALPYSHTGGGAGTKIESQRRDYLQKYYETIAKNISITDKVILMGPSFAKLELQRTIEKKKTFAGTVVSKITVGRMTDRQIAAKVRSFFKLPLTEETNARNSTGRVSHLRPKRENYANE